MGFCAGSRIVGIAGSPLMALIITPAVGRSDSTETRSVSEDEAVIRCIPRLRFGFLCRSYDQGRWFDVDGGCDRDIVSSDIETRAKRTGFEVAPQVLAGWADATRKR